MATRIWKISLALLLLSVMTFSAAAPALAAPQLVGPTDPAELEAFIDDFMAAQMEPNHVPGVTISVVKDGQLFFAKGYGYAEVKNRVPVDPDTTLFDTGSVGKTFTWTAVMQLVEQGKLDLNADVNTYLDFKIPATYLNLYAHHLMTHTPALKTACMGSKLLHLRKSCLSQWLARNIPARCARPASFRRIQLWASLAGYIVERVGNVLRRIYRDEHPTTVRDGKTHLSAAAAAGTRCPYVGRLHVRQRRIPGPRFRADEHCACGIRQRQRYRYGSLHDRAPAKWPL
jgi:CubicO group peptidase (beta-lactamase class C family)